MNFSANNFDNLGEIKEHMNHQKLILELLLDNLNKQAHGIKKVIRVFPGKTSDPGGFHK